MNSFDDIIIRVPGPDMCMSLSLSVCLFVCLQGAPSDGHGEGVECGTIPTSPHGVGVKISKRL